MRIRDFLGLRPSALGYQERIDALNAALILVGAMDEDGAIPKVPYGTLTRWGSVKANLMLLTGELWEELQALERER